MSPRPFSLILVLLVVLCTENLAFAQLGQGEFVSRTFEHEGYTRSYNLYVPLSYDGTSEWPLIISFHGFSMSAGTSGFSQPLLDGFSTVADTAQFLLVYPQGLQIPFPPFGVNTGWNVNGDFAVWDDIMFVERILDDVEANYAVDRRRVHAAGVSLGGMMSFAVVCRLSHRIASIGAVAGPMVEKYFIEGCPTARPVSILQFHGTADAPWVPYDGVDYADWAPRPIPETLSWWARHNNCSTDSLVTPLPDVDQADNSTVTRIEYPDCDDGTEVVHYRIEGGGHSWPGRDGAPPINMDVDATAIIWEFFTQHPHPTSGVSIESEPRDDAVHPHSFALSQNYPNPFNLTTTISYDLPQAADVTLRVYDMLGRQVRELASGKKIAGTYEVSFDAGTLPSGVYFYRLAAGDFVETKRMVVVR